MGNYKFRLADMMPNAWFYKIKDMSNSKNNNSKQSMARSSTTTKPYLQSPQTPRIQPNRASYYYSNREDTEKLCSISSMRHYKATDTRFPPVECPRRSKKKSRRKAVKSLSSSVSTGCNCRSVWKSSEFYVDDNVESLQRPCRCSITSSATDIILDISTESSDKKIKEFDKVSWHQLPPILTKPVKKKTEQVFHDKKIDHLISKEKNRQSKRISSSSSPHGLHRLRMRANSPRIVSRKAQVHSKCRNRAMQTMRIGLSDSFAVVKSSSDPHKDFRDSMVEMIIENNIRRPNDLEELLACYLSLNSNEYHDVIVKVFQQIWFDLINIKL